MRDIKDYRRKKPKTEGGREKNELQSSKKRKLNSILAKKSSMTEMSLNDDSSPQNVR